MRRTTITDLKSNLSARLKSVASGEPLLVTDNNRPVAVIQPLTGRGSANINVLVSSGVLAPAREKLDLSKLLKIPKARAIESLSEAIVEERDSR